MMFEVVPKILVTSRILALLSVIGRKQNVNILLENSCMNSINTLIKWPGGKAREIKYIKHLIPEFERYIEPFFGGGAVFFYLKPKKAVINDISKSLMDFYRLTKEQNAEFRRYLEGYDSIFNAVISACDRYSNKILTVYSSYKADGGKSKEQLAAKLRNITILITDSIDSKVSDFLILDKKLFEEFLIDMAVDKMIRTVRNEQKTPFGNSDLKENLITGFASGVYMYFRRIYNNIHTGNSSNTSLEFNTANFYFIREYCYGSMFRYNSMGEFNIPYGGMSYNRKRLRTKIDNIFSAETKELFASAGIRCSDFESFIREINPTENDFMFLDPPYDTDFSDYEGKEFTLNDQCRLAKILKDTKAKFILIIKNTDFIFSLYKKDFTVLNFDKTYIYNVRSRNNRNAEHLIVTNILL